MERVDILEPRKAIQDSLQFFRKRLGGIFYLPSIELYELVSSETRQGETRIKRTARILLILKPERI